MLGFGGLLRVEGLGCEFRFVGCEVWVFNCLSYVGGRFYSFVFRVLIWGMFIFYLFNRILSTWKVRIEFFVVAGEVEWGF